ncbi:MAG: hypothetical protein VB036_05245, partial [Propionicimonas sp.]|nr:hypothetical protein [Propionicimonas sp.]
MTYGFRLFSATLAEETGYLPKRWRTGGFDYAKHLVKVGKEMRQVPSLGSGGVQVWPIPHPADLSNQDIKGLVAPMSAPMLKGDMVGRVNSIALHSATRVSIVVTVGRVGVFDIAMGQR